MKAVSDITNTIYEAEDCVFFRNAHQSAFYVKHGAKLVDLFVDSSIKFVFVFTKEDHKRLIGMWVDNKPIDVAAKDNEERGKNI